MKIAISIFELSLGSVASIAGYNVVYGGYAGKLVSKGLIPGALLVVLDFSSARGEVKIMLQDKIVTLSKPEANALCIETFAEED